VEVPELRRHHLSTSIPPLTCFPKGEHSDSHSVATALHAEGSVGLALQCRLHGLAGQLIGRALESIGFTDRDDNRHHYPPELHRALSYIHQDFAEPITVADLSQAACCSPSRLNRAFRQHLSSSVSRYLVDYRLERAAEMLCGTSHSVDQIASRCGFSQRAYFSRSFKAYFGQAPASYRAEA
jgi:AraC-like DNA-binding protein